MLGGKVKVNDHEIAEWTATRVKGGGGVDDKNSYFCTLDYRAQDGYAYRAEFHLQHIYGNGALMLAANVLAKGCKVMVPVPINGDEDTMKIFKASLSRHERNENG